MAFNLLELLLKNFLHFLGKFCKILLDKKPFLINIDEMLYSI